MAAYQAKQEASLVDNERVEEDEMARLEECVKGMPVENALSMLGVRGPGYGRKDVVRALFPGNGFATRSEIDNAKMSAAYKVAIQLLDG